jgi:acetylornithine deacetylase
MSIQINQDRLTKLLQEMVRIESINQDLVPGGSGEKKVAEFSANFMNDAGLEAHVQQTGPGHYNAVGILRGTGGGQNLLIDAHLDTVSIEGMAEPFSGRVDDGKLYGRGAADDKGGVAAGIEAAISIREAGIRLTGDLIVAGVSGEEYASEGSEAFIDTYKEHACGCIIGEPSRMSQGLYLGVGVGSGGYVWIEYLTRGQRAHGSLYQVGVDAIDAMQVVLKKLAGLKQRLISQEPYVNPHANIATTWYPSLHNSLISGGHDLATYPDFCKLSVERRTVYGETFELVRQEVDQIVADALLENSALQVECKILFERNPWQAQKGPLLDTLLEEVQTITGKQPLIYSVGGWDDGAISSAAGIPTVVFGPSGNDWHGPNEYVDLASLHKCAQAMALAAARFCK